MPKKYFTKKEREKIQQRSHYRCEYCQLLEVYIDCVNDHIIARSLGGADSLDNIANACHRCNGHKYNKIRGFDEITQQITRLYNPREDDWKSHFKWSEDFLLIVGITSIGRVTIDLLKVNNKKTQKLRQLLMVNLEHPPKDLI